MHFTPVDHHLRYHCANIHRSQRIIVVVLIDGFYFVQKSELIICSDNIQSLEIEWKNAKWCGTCQKRIWRMTSRTEWWRNMKMECQVMYGCASFYHDLIADNFFPFWHFARFSKNTISELVNLFDLFQPLRRSLFFNLFDFCFYLIEYYNAGLIIVIKQIINGNASYLFAIFVCAPFQMKINGVWFVFDVLFASTDSLKLAFWWTKFIWFHYFHADCSRFLVSGLTKSFSLCQPHQKRLKTPTR